MSWRWLHPAVRRKLSEVVAPAMGSGNRITVFACRRWLRDAAGDNSPPYPPSAPLDVRVGTVDTKEGERTWTWSTPSPLRPGRGAGEIPVVPRVNLTPEEVTRAIEGQGATDVRVIDLRGKSTGMGDYVIFSTGVNQFHMRRMANMVVQTLKQRKLTNATGITGAEGIDCDDWMLVDCDNLIVHFMTAETRQELDLETHWENIASGSALKAKRKRGEEGYVEDPVDWDEDFGEEAAKAAGRGVEDGR